MSYNTRMPESVLVDLDWVTVKKLPCKCHDNGVSQRTHIMSWSPIANLPSLVTLGLARYIGQRVVIDNDNARLLPG
ncbi:hypothetical protein VTN49DRAFT_3537 [Thermomyces lanuginosus]|uniref:uncharacterized protein n=1 Tax=Thermomyces lanuginosus TaxID=5541 RepID=UPI003742819F